MNRDYGNKIEPYLVTGFASPCAEYAEMRLSLDERFDSFNPALKRLTIEVDYPLFGFKTGDLIDVLMGQPLRHNDLIYAVIGTVPGVYRYQVIQGQPSLFPLRFKIEDIDDSITGVVVGIHRSLVSK